MNFFKRIDVETFVILFLAIMALLLVGGGWGGIITANGLISNLGGAFVNVFGFMIVFYGIEFFQQGFNVHVRDKIMDEKNVAAAVYQAGIAIALAILISKGFL